MYNRAFGWHKAWTFCYILFIQIHQTKPNQTHHTKSRKAPNSKASNFFFSFQITTQGKKRKKSCKVFFFCCFKVREKFETFFHLLNYLTGMAGGGSGNRPPWKEAAPPRPTISLPPRAASMETLFNGGFSPGPMTLLSGFLTDGDDCNKSFSQLLAGAMASPVAAAVHDSSGFFSPSQVLYFFLSLITCKFF